MKLLTVEQSQHQAQELLSRDIGRANEIRDVLKRYEERMVKADKDFMELMVTQRIQREKEEAEWKERKGSLEREVESLLKKQRQALVPLTMREDAIVEMEKQAVRSKKEVSERELENEKLHEALVRRLNDVGEKERDLADREIKISITEKGIADQKKSTINQAQELSKVMATFAVAQKEYEGELARREADIKANDIILSEREKRIEIGLKELESKQKILTSREQRIKVVYDNLKNNGIKY